MTPDSLDPSSSQRLRDSQERYRRLFEDSPVSLWELDYSESKRQIDALRARGVSDLRAYFRDNPDEARDLLLSARALAVNAATVRLHKASSKEELMAVRQDGARRKGPFSSDAHDVMLEARIALAEGRDSFDAQAPATAVTGEKLQVILRWSILPGHEATWDRVLVSVTDISDLTRAAASLAVSEKRYRGLFENCPVSLWELDYSQAKKQIDALRASGVSDLMAYFRDHPEEAAVLTTSGRVLSVNAATLRLHNACTMEEMMARQVLPFGPDAREPLVEARVALAEGRTAYEVQAPATGAEGDAKLHVILRWSILPGHEDTWDRVLVSATDVTDLVQAKAELQGAYRKLMNVREEERRRQATELHDSVGQGLVGFKLTLQNALNACTGKEHEDVLTQITRLAGQCDVLIAEIRRICQGLYPTTLEALGLPAALKHLADGTRAGGIDTELLCRERLHDLRFDGDVEIALFRIAQEALTNAVRHGRADRIQISLEHRAGALSMEVRDNGLGFDPDAVNHGGLGLGSMDERAQAVGGTLSLRSRPGLTVVSVRLAAQPLARDDESD